MLLRSVIVKIFVALCISLSLRAEEIRVELATQSKLASAYLFPMFSQNTSLQEDYIKKLHKVLHFDLHFSGMMKILAADEKLEKNLQNSEPNVIFNSPYWDKTRISFIIRGVVQEKKLDIYLYNVQSTNIKFFQGIVLSGELQTDRRQIHKLADAIIKTLFAVDGIANSKLLYSLQQQNADPKQQPWKAEIWECDWDGENQRQVTHEQNYCITPVIVPQNNPSEMERFIYVSYKTGQPKIYFSSVKSNLGKALIDLRGNQLLPAISWQRDKIAFISDASGRADLFVQLLDVNGTLSGKPIQLFSYPRSTQGSPTFSPDGKKIAFVSDKDGSPRIYIISSTVNNQRRPEAHLISKVNRENICPVWSPDGKKIAYSAKTNDVRQIWIYDVEKKEERQLTTGPGNKENPFWAPNSIHLVFNSTDPDSSELYLVNLHQPESVKITKGPGKKHYPTWGIR